MVFLQLDEQPDTIRVKILNNRPKNGRTEEIPEEEIQRKIDVLENLKKVEITWSCLTHSVYVIRLNPEVRGKKKMINQNPHPNLTGEYLYVGMTGLTIEKRINNHIEDHKSCNLVKLFYKEPFPERHEIGMSFDKANRRERDLADELRKEGFWVYQN